MLTTVTRNKLTQIMGGSSEARQLLGILALSEGPGSIFFVDSVTGSDVNSGENWADALATIDAGINKCSANNGDVVYVAPGHSETISNATSIIPDVAGVMIIGLGRGASRPTITLDNTSSNIPISGAGTTLQNFLIRTTGTVDVTAGITVTGADCLLEDIEIRHTAADSEIVDSIIVTTGGDRTELINIKVFGFAGGNAAAAGISIPAALNRVRIVNPWIVGLFSAGCIENVTAAATDLLIEGAVLGQRHASQDAGIAIVSTATGDIISPRIRTATNDANGFNLAITPASNTMNVYDPLVVNANGERGGFWGTVSAAA